MSTAEPVAWILAVRLSNAIEEMLVPLAESPAQFMLAGSLRRGCQQVHDLEYVAVPKVAEVRGDDLFGTPVNTNLMIDKLDRMLACGQIEKAIYSDGKTRWGTKYRGFMYGGVRHELFMTGGDTFGLHVVIRTGPAEFSKAFVIRLRAAGYEARGGQVFAQGRHTPIAVPTEQRMFELAGLKYIDPREREFATDQISQS